jgi:hypothetical protein
MSRSGHNVWRDTRLNLVLARGRVTGFALPVLVEGLLSQFRQNATRSADAFARLKRHRPVTGEVTFSLPRTQRGM